MEKLWIKNRKAQKLAVIVEKPEGEQRGLAFVMHGLGGFKEQVQIEMYAKTFLEKGCVVVRFDTANTIGESGGSYENATITSYYEDLEDVIAWANAQEWYKEPFLLMGSSLGGICIGLYAQRHPEKVRALAPACSVISGVLIRSTEDPNDVAEWERTGYKITPSTSIPGLLKKLKWHQFVEDSLTYDLLPEAHTLTMPVLLIVGSEDNGTPLAHQRLLFDKLPGPKELHVIEGAPHTFRDPKHLMQIKKILGAWIDSLEK